MSATFDDAVRARLQAPNIWYVGTVFADGAPQVSPMWVDLEGEGELTFNTSVGRVKEENLRRDPRVYLSHADAPIPSTEYRSAGWWRASSRARRHTTEWTGWPVSTWAANDSSGSCRGNNESR
ncbi:hypothetical protein CJI59_06500 [Streptomyces sp. Alain-F2R5]|nr:hypothetical protein CJI59_06500 [Streptomyces sp. Alain-F2R5]